MKQIKNINIETLENNLIYPIYEDQLIDPQLNKVLDYNLDKLVNKKFKELTVIHTLGKYKFETITFIGLGSSKKITSKQIRDIAALIKLDEHATIYLEGINTDHLDIHTITRAFIESYLQNSYQEHKIGHEPKVIHEFDIIFSQAELENDIQLGKVYGEGINYARMLSDTPSNLMTPDTLVDEAIKLSQKYPQLECTILNKSNLEKMEAGGILSVNQGSNIPAYMICLKYNNSDDPYTAVIGKGLTFDSGGYNLKSDSYGMKYDMCGGADVLGVMQILAASQAKANVYGIIPTTENLVSDKAYKPQDVITTLSKKTVEIVSTDAEGRLILCDAITYVQQLGVKKIIDLATLTGACVSALGDVYTGVFSNCDEYYDEFVQALQISDEKGWRLPLDSEYFEKLKSTSADFKNSAGKPGGGASVAANFLEAFIEEGTQWLHLDIAGSADNDGTGATGAIIRSVVNMINLKQSSKSERIK